MANMRRVAALLSALLYVATLIASPPLVHAGTALEDLVAARNTGTVVLETRFEDENPDNWVVEGGGQVTLEHGAMMVRSLDENTTIWHKQRLYGDVLIEFVATIDPPVAAANLNVFVHATDPSGQPVYVGDRSGVYAEYHELPLYIFTFTGDQDRDGAPGYARFRKDPGFTLLAENEHFKAVTGETYRISILIEGERLRYFINDELVHDYMDPDPYRSGWFAFRTWNTNLTVRSLVVRQLREFDIGELARHAPRQQVGIRRNLISNPSFEEGIQPNGLPVDWSLFGAQFMSVVSEQATDGTYSVKIVDTDDRGSGIRSVYLPAKPGATYRVEVDVLPIEGRGVVYIDFTSEGTRVTAPSRPSASSTGQWETLAFEGTAPQGASEVSVILYTLKPETATVYFDNVRLYDLSEASTTVSDKEPSSMQIGYRPESGSAVETNPPSFVWLPEPWAKEYILEISREPEFPRDGTIRIDGLKYPMHMPAEALAEGVWFWRYWGIAEDGSVVGPSALRYFRVAEDAVALSLPPVEEVVARVPTHHPRLFIRPDEVADLKSRWSRLELSVYFRHGYVAAIIGPQLPRLQPTAEQVREALTVLQELAVLYAATGEERYAQAGRTLFLHMTKVDPMPAVVPEGTGKDAIFMALLPAMSRSYDWLYHAFTSEERVIALDYLHDLGSYTFERLRTPPFETNPYSSHEGRILGFLAELAIATMGELPEAEVWLDFVLRVLYNVYPAWGGSDGGWSEGAYYWASYMNFILDALDAIELATGVQIYQKPFFQNTGYYKLYTHPPMTGVPFGDGLGEPVSAQDRTAMSRLAAITGNGHFTWYAERAGGTERRSGIVGALVQRPLPPAQPPSNLSLARYFADVGLVTMHTQLADPASNVVFQLRSSPYGSVSHAHSDQNTFVLYAYGDGVAISSGYYPWSRSAHHSQWTNETKSKNGILINGLGQRTFNMDAKGEIVNFIHTDTFDYAVGEAAQAYIAAVDTYKRHVVFIRPDLFVIADDVRTPEPSTVDWLLHSAFPLTWDPAEQRAHTSGKNGQLDAYLISGQSWSASITDAFVPPPELDTYDPQWHLTLSNAERAERHLIAAVLVPNPAGEKSVQLLDAGVIAEGDAVTIRLVYSKDGQERNITIELELTDEGAARGPVIH